MIVTCNIALARVKSLLPSSEHNVVDLLLIEVSRSSVTWSRKEFGWSRSQMQQATKESFHCQYVIQTSDFQYPVVSIYMQTLPMIKLRLIESAIYYRKRH